MFQSSLCAAHLSDPLTGVQMLNVGLFTERECAPVGEASDPLCVWRHRFGHRGRVQEVPGHRPGHPAAGIAGSGGQGKAPPLQMSEHTLNLELGLRV